ncbi:MAG: threonylcarbamoyl-AMP synthase [Candidatus Vogelbacteria bacterium CG10_big_fil_rev_8_21_14_0_10_45_14]|uniref:L-threonylcarbamoyladenylate synthase n=1 Tax=Candidatus Vogelbacteria bacterium CG10_big_fil_rev_8_21_14_0_10_45_14 TaxID=1975042 RepID=A0A2H0RKX0_9BACT|nr:MAG: threonylcarbamoyl-AMP synthase [Candidatus Vogelbacteria bacterium CG10_big_fil_rev_8_21_14_0_10_45_14]
MRTIRLHDHNGGEVGELLASMIEGGGIMVYPTDTVYGVGCRADDGDAIARLRDLTQKYHPLTVLVNSMADIESNCEVPDYAYAFLKKLPGPLTVILKTKGLPWVHKSILGPNMSLGLRYIGHPIQKIVESFRYPIITTSANLNGEPTISDVAHLPLALSIGVDVVIDAGILGGKPSTIIDCTGDEPIVLRGDTESYTATTK